MKFLVHAAKVLTSNIEHYNQRATERFMPRYKPFRGIDRRRNPRTCSICGGPLQQSTKPTDRLKWFSCGRCRQSQVGIPA